MQFRLVYEGPLKSSSDPREKHAIRQHFHHQLSVLWNNHGVLKSLKNNTLQFDMLTDPKYGFRFVSLVRDSLSLGCNLDILFLRREAPGSIVHGGDIDNRIKILVDALKVPENQNEVTNISPTSNEDPFYCLMEKDSLICDLNVSTDRLLLPVKAGESQHNVHLVINVRVSVIDPSKTWVGWGL